MRKGGAGRIEGIDRAERLALLVSDLPVLPERVAEGFALVQGDCSLEELVEYVEGDVGLVERVLRVANSPYFGFVRRVDSVFRAGALLGVKVMRKVIYSALLGSLMGLDAIGVELYRYMVRLGMLSSRVGLWCDGLSDEMCFTAGLFYDVGKVGLWLVVPDLVREVVRRSGDEVFWCGCEDEVIGVRHREVGCELVRRWGLPEWFEGVVAGEAEGVYGDVLRVVKRCKILLWGERCGEGDDVDVEDGCGLEILEILKECDIAV